MIPHQDDFSLDPLTDDPTHFPADPALELVLLGAILLDPPIIEDLDYIGPDDFYNAQYREVFKRMRRLWEEGSPIDGILIADRDTELLSVCTEAYAVCPSSLQAHNYARKIKDLAQKRSMLPLLDRAAGMSMNGVNFEAVRDYLLSELESPTRQSIHQTWQPKQASGLVDPPKAREWLLEGWIYKGQILMVYGPPGIKKTLALMNMCAAMSLGHNWLVRRNGQADDDSLVTFRCTRPARILWLDYDNGEFETEIRIRAALMAYDGLGEAQFSYMSETTPWLALDNPTHVRRLISLANSMQADVIVLDALGMVLGEVDENAPEVAKVVSKLKEIRAATGAALICVHHPSKAGAQTAQANTYNAAGSAKFSNFFEWVVELRKGEEDDTIVAEVVKNRGWAKAKKFAASFSYKHFGPEHPDLSHELESFKFYPEPIKTKNDKRTEAIREAIGTLLRDINEMNQTELTRATKSEVESALGGPVGEAAIREMIKTMAENGELTARSTGERRPVFYSLPDSVDPVDRS